MLSAHGEILTCLTIRPIPRGTALRLLVPTYKCAQWVVVYCKVSMQVAV